MSATAGLFPNRTSPGPAGHHHVVAVSFVILTELMLFCGLVAAYIVLRGQAMEWPPAGQPRLPVGITALSTLLLLGSGWRVHQLSQFVGRRDVVAVRRLLRQTVMLGAAFFLIQGAEWGMLLGHGLTTASSVYGATFYTIVGCHAVHVLAGLAALMVVARRVGQLNQPEGDTATFDSWASPVLGARLFWLFVVGVWPPLYALVYLW